MVTIGVKLATIDATSKRRGSGKAVRFESAGHALALLRTAAYPAVTHLLWRPSASSLATLALGAVPALAARSLLSEIPGVGNETAVTVDSAGNVWIATGGGGESNHISEYTPYPSTAQEQEWSGEGHLECGQVDSLDVDNVNGYVYASNTCGAIVYFEPNGTFRGSLPVGGGLPPVLGISIDNSGGPSDGRIYVVGGGSMEAFEPDGTPAEFSDTESYIAGNQILGAPGIANHNTGSPEIRFDESYGQLSAIGVGNREGNIYIATEYQGEVFEYDSTGAFVQAFPSSGRIAEDPTNGNVEVGCGEFSPSGQFLEGLSCASTAFNAEGYFYSGASIYNRLPKIKYESPSEPSSTSGTLNATVDPNGSMIEECHFEYGSSEKYGNVDTCEPSSLPYSSETNIHVKLAALTSETTYHYRVVIKTSAGVTRGRDQTYTPHGVIGLRTDPPADITGTAATLAGSFVGNGQDTHYYFEYGSAMSYGDKTAVPPGGDAGSPQNAPERTSVSSRLGGLNPYTDYHYRIVASNESGTSYGEDQLVRTAKAAPLIPKVYASAVHSEGATLNGQINPGGDKTTDAFEWGASSCSANPDPCISAPATEPELGSNSRYQHVSTQLSGLSPGTTYYFRIVATNGIGPSVSEEGTVTTYPHISAIKEACPNAHVRQQTGAALLLDCRAYELVSAANTGGYDVESDLVPARPPIGGYPEAENPPRVLYGVHDGGIPGTDNPTNSGVDPYVATRGEDGWSTEYVGVPANNPFATKPFSSAPSGAGASLDTFAFGGPEGCSPALKAATPASRCACQAANWSRAWCRPRLRTRARSPTPTATSPKTSRQTANTSSSARPPSSPRAATSNGDVSIYDRDLKTGETHVVSNSPGGGAASLPAGGRRRRMPRPRRYQRDRRARHLHRRLPHPLRPEGLRRRRRQRLLAPLHGHRRLGTKRSTSPPGPRDGVLFDGMTADGSKVFFTTKDKHCSPTKTPTQAPTSMRPKSRSEGATLTRISTGTEGTGNTDACDPVAKLTDGRTGTRSARPDCGVVAIGGGGGSGRRSGRDLLPLPRAARRRRQRHRKPAQPLPRRPRLCPALHCHPRPQRPAGPRRASRKPKPARPPTSRSPRRRIRRLYLDPAADRL